MKNYDLIAILGPTATGKTALAAHLADRINSLCTHTDGVTEVYLHSPSNIEGGSAGRGSIKGAEIISADSRQVYRRMDLGTGKDLEDYEVNGHHIPYHLIDIAEPGTKYNVYQYQQDFIKAYEDIRSRGKLPIVCGGSGLYIESILRGYQMADVPENKELRQRLEGKSLEELTEILKTYKTLHNTTDTDTTKRAIRAIEIAEYQAHLDNGKVNGQRSMVNGQRSTLNAQRSTVNGHFSEQRAQSDACIGYAESRRNCCEAKWSTLNDLNSLVIGVKIDRELRREKITRRLKQRLEEGMVDEVRRLLEEGIPAEDLIYYGLEYKFLTEYLTGQLSYDEMFERIEIAIHQFAKRQMTWFRGMERRGFTIHWIDATLSMEDKIQKIIQLWQ